MIIKAILKPIIDSFFKSIIGATLIVSGLIKANDTIGFGIKLSEYFEDGALAYRIQDMFGWSSFSLEWLIDYSLYLAIFICVLEIVLGFCLIVGARIKETVFLLMSMLLFFLVLTLHTATCDSTVPSSNGISIQCVTDCGCFGDALKFTPWGSFTKDLILIVLLIISSVISFDFYKRKKYRPYKVSYLNSLFDDIFAVIFTFIFTFIWCIIVSWYFPLLMVLTFFIVYFLIKKYYSSEILIVLSVSLVSLTFSYYTLNNLPVKDFRAYKVGSDVRDIEFWTINGILEPCENFKPFCNLSPEDSCPDIKPTDPRCVDPNSCQYNPAFKDGDVWPYDSNGNGKIDEGEYWQWGPDYQFSQIEWWGCEKNYPDENGDCPPNKPVSDNNVADILQDFEKLALIVCSDFEKSDKTIYCKINALKIKMEKEGINTFYVFTVPPNPEQREKFIGGNPYLIIDEKEAKTIIRSNPGILLMQKGVIKQKWHYNNIPDLKEVLKILND